MWFGGGQMSRKLIFGAMNGSVLRFLCLPVVFVCVAMESIVFSFARMVEGWMCCPSLYLAAHPIRYLNVAAVACAGCVVHMVMAMCSSSNIMRMVSGLAWCPSVNVSAVILSMYPSFSLMTIVSVVVAVCPVVFSAYFVAR